MSTSKLASTLDEQFDNPWEEQFERGWDVHFEKGWDAGVSAAFEIIEQELGRTGNEYMLARLKSRFMRELEMKGAETMQDFDTFWAHAYNGGYISGKHDNVNKVEVITYQLPGEHQWRKARSYLAAKQRITRFGVRNTGS